MDKSTANEGWDMLQQLVDNGDYRASFLMSRLYFDPSKAAKESIGFYRAEWETMREKCGVTADNVTAHNYLMKAWRTDAGKTDPALLYELGCDFLYGRGTTKNFGKARTCFERVDELVGDDSPYREAVKDKLARSKQHSSEPIEP